MAVLDHLRHLCGGILSFQYRSCPRHHRAAAFDCAFASARQRPGHHLCPTGDRRGRAPCFSRGSVTHVGRCLSSNRGGARYHSAFRSTGGGWAFSLRPESALLRQPADGGGNWRTGEPRGLAFSSGGELAVCLSADLSRGRSSSAKPGRTVSRLLPHSPAFLAVAYTACVIGKPHTAMGSGVCR